MTKKCHNHRPTNVTERKRHETLIAARQDKHNLSTATQFSLPQRDDCKTRTDIVHCTALWNMLIFFKFHMVQPSTPLSGLGSGSITKQGPKTKSHKQWVQTG